MSRTCFPDEGSKFLTVQIDATSCVTMMIESWNDRATTYIEATNSFLSVIVLLISLLINAQMVWLLFSHMQKKKQQQLL